MEDRNHGLAWTKPKNGKYNTQHSQQTQSERSLYIELQKQKLDQIMQEKHENFSVQAYSFLEVKLRRLQR